MSTVWTVLGAQRQKRDKENSIMQSLKSFLSTLEYN